MVTSASPPSGDPLQAGAPSHSGAPSQAAELEDALAPLPDPGLQPLGPINAVTLGAEPTLQSLDELELAGDPAIAHESREASTLPGHVTRHLVGGTSALGLGVAIERGTGFLANILAARLAGTSTFGAYSLAISTANNISTYAAGGIGATAARFSGKYGYGSPGYSTLARALMIVSVASAALAALGLWLGAGPIAHLLGKRELTTLLRWAALSAAGIILLECARGFFVGQRRLVALVLLSVLVGAGLLTMLPLAAHAHSPIRMIVVQGATTTSAVLICLLFSRRLGLHAPLASTLPAAPSLQGTLPAARPRLRHVLREVWSFGGVQLAGLIGSNLAGWWLTTLVARDDTSMVQMSFFAIASQWRNLAGLLPGLLTEGSYAVMADADSEGTATPHRVMALCSYASLSVSLLLAAAGMTVVPWVLGLLYGGAYRAAGLTVAVALAIAVVHMGNAPAAARLTIVSIRAAGIINTVWAVAVAVAASLLLFHGGEAWQAMAIYFGAHVLSATLVLLTLRYKDHVPPGMTASLAIGTLGSGSLAALALLRASRPALTLPVTAVMAGLLLVLAGALFLLGRRYRWLPSAAVLHSLRARLLGRWRARTA